MDKVFISAYWLKDGDSQRTIEDAGTHHAFEKKRDDGESKLEFSAAITDEYIDSLQENTKMNGEFILDTLREKSGQEFEMSLYHIVSSSYLESKRTTICLDLIQSMNTNGMTTREIYSVSVDYEQDIFWPFLYTAMVNSAATYSDHPNVLIEIFKLIKPDLSVEQLETILQSYNFCIFRTSESAQELCISSGGGGKFPSLVHSSKILAPKYSGTLTAKSSADQITSANVFDLTFSGFEPGCSNLDFKNIIVKFKILDTIQFVDRYF